MTTASVFSPPTVRWHGSRDPQAPLVALLHGRGSDETGIVGLADHLPVGPSYAAVRAPIGEGGGFAWFANRRIGRPVAASLSETMAWFRGWLDGIAPRPRPVVLVGFSGGAAFAGGLLLDDPARSAGAAILYGTLPFDAGVPTSGGRLDGVPVLVAHGEDDRVIPRELLEHTWNYLRTDSRAEVTGIRQPGGHALTATAVAGLRTWLAPLVSARGTRT
jgi:phospholipase/carboxylesterase